MPHVIGIVAGTETPQARLETKLNRQILITGKNTDVSFSQRITLCGRKRLHPFTFLQGRHVIEYLRSKSASQFQGHSPEIVAVIQRHIRPVETGFPVFRTLEMRNISVPPIQGSHYSQLVFRRNAPQVTSPQVYIVQVAIRQTDITTVGSLLCEFSRHGFHRSHLPGPQRMPFRSILDGLFRSGGLFHFGHDIHLECIHHFRIVLIFHHHRPVQGRIFFRSLLRTYCGYRPQTRANQYRTYVSHFTLHF